MIVGASKTYIRHLTAAQIKVLSTPITLVAGVPGALYWPIRAAVYYHAGTVPYDASGAELRIGWPGVPEPAVTISLSCLENAADHWRTETAKEHDGSDLVGAPLVAYAAADPTLGNGTLDIIVEYRKVTV